MSHLRLSVLDQSPIAEGSTGAQALANTLDLARLADELGFHRYWVAEHHGGPSLAGPSPEVLIGPIASATSRIRVGSGGVMLPHYSPLKVAESFSVLSGLFPGRIDLGIGRASGTDPLTTFALQRDRRQAAPDDFPQQLAELLALARATACPPTTFRAPGGAAGAARVARSRGCWAPRRRARSGRRSSASPTPSPTSSTRAAPTIAADYRARFQPTSGRLPAPRRRRRRLGRVRRHRRGGPPAGGQRAHDARAAAPGPARSRSRRSRRRCASWARATAGAPSPAAARSSARRTPCATGSRRWRRVRRRGGHRRHDHARPRRAPALLRAAGRGLRAAPRRAARPDAGRR